VTTSRFSRDHTFSRSDFLFCSSTSKNPTTRHRHQDTTLTAPHLLLCEPEVVSQTTPPPPPTGWQSLSLPHSSFPMASSRIQAALKLVRVHTPRIMLQRQRLAAQQQQSFSGGSAWSPSSALSVRKPGAIYVESILDLPPRFQRAPISGFEMQVIEVRAVCWGNSTQEKRTMERRTPLHREGDACERNHAREMRKSIANHEGRDTHKECDTHRRVESHIAAMFPFRSASVLYLRWRLSHWSFCSLLSTRFHFRPSCVQSGGVFDV
jgi:hypothetical protein